MLIEYEEASSHTINLFSSTLYPKSNKPQKREDHFPEEWLKSENMITGGRGRSDAIYLFYSYFEIKQDITLLWLT